MMKETFSQQRDRLIGKVVAGSSWNDEELLGLFRFQYQFNDIYRQYCDLVKRPPASVHRTLDIPFLPVSVFKHHAVRTGEWSPVRQFMSSGTTGQLRSEHHIRDLGVYHRSCMHSFEEQYGNPGAFTWLALLPSYLEAGDSSLVEMVRYFMTLSGRKHGFFRNDFAELSISLDRAAREGEPVVLIGVSYALLDFSGQHKGALPERLIVMETGGMKGRRSELTREELHREIRIGLGVEQVHSEYGMTEMMHQFYARGQGLFMGSAQARILVREINDPFCVYDREGSGLINIIDPGNVDSCAFIATDDLGTLFSNGQFEVLGRSDNSEMRGCNLLYTSEDLGPVTD